MNKKISEKDELFENAQNEFIGKNKAEQNMLVYSYFGLAMYFAQCIEQTLELMFILEKLANGEKITQKFIDSIFDKLERSKATMGVQINQIKNTYSISQENELKLTSVLGKRNYLTHKFFKINSSKFYTEQGKLEMIKECTDFVNEFQNLDNELAIYHKNYQDKIGLTDEIIEKETKLVREEENERIKKKYGG